MVVTRSLLLSTLITCALLAGCAFDADKGYPDAEAVPTPRFDRVPNTDRYVYEPTGDKCFTKAFSHTVEESGVPSAIVRLPIYDTVSFSEKYDISSEEISTADHLHVAAMRLRSSTGLGWLSWVRFRHDDDLVAWGSPEALRVDGSVDVRDAYDGGTVTLDGSVRARAPKKGTKVGAQIDFIGFYDCN